MGKLLIPPLPAVHIAVAGADGVGASARSWAIVAKAGMKQADAPEETARPRSPPQMNDNRRAKSKSTPSGSRVAVCFEKVGGRRRIVLHGGPHEEFIVIKKKKKAVVSCFA